MDPWQIVVLCVVGVAGNFFGVVTGGSGILATLTMYAFGVPLPNAVANSRFSGIGTDSAAIPVFHMAGRINYRLAIPLTGVALIASAAGARTLEWIPPETLKRIIGGTILLVVGLMLVFPKIGGGAAPERPRTAGRWLLGGALIAVCTLVAAIAGGAAGPLYSAVLIGVFGQTIVESAATRKVVSIGLTAGSVATYIALGLVDWELAIPLAAANAVGGWSGSRFAVRVRAGAVRAIFLVGVGALGAWLIVHG